jgi:23S rRNA (cytidine1920-2'-O)/16S rRNA (cytidine1409-2'-O)-methyltransferase
VSPLGLRALDIGASTGGFTDCLLQHGAAHVVALDAGQGQLHQTLREDVRVTNIEKYNARNLTPADTGLCDMAVMDVSFISQTLILPKIPDVLREGGILISLIKPQFEAGRAALNKQGIVRHAKDRVLAVRRVLSAAAEAGLSCCGLAPSPILGGDGNEEFLAYFQKKTTPTVKEMDISRVVLKKEVQI